MQITVLSSSDIHGYFTARDYHNPSQNIEGGLSRLASLVEEERAKALDPVIYIDNGDFAQGSPLAYLYQKQGLAKKMMAGLNALDADAFSVGNHEFNYGKDFLEKLMFSTRCYSLSGNVLINNKPAFGPAFTTKKYGPVKVGILGLVTPAVQRWEDPDSIRGLRFISALDACKRWIPVLKEQEKCDLVIVAYHGGFERDPYTAEEIEGQSDENEAYAILHSGLDIDLLITGHQHQLIADEINGIAVVQSACKGKALAKTVFNISRAEQNEIVAHLESCENIKTADYEESQTILDIYQKDVDYLTDQLQSVIGQSEGQFKIYDVFQAQKEGHPYIDLINKIQRESLDADLSCTAFFGEEMEGLGQDISLGQVLANYPFANKLCKVKINGQELKDILEYNARYFALNEDGEITIATDYLYPKKQFYHYDLFAGIDYDYDLKQKRGQRLVRLEYQGQAVKKEDQFTLAVNNFRANGGGHFPHYSPDKIVETHEKDLPELVSQYIKAHSPFKK